MRTSVLLIGFLLFCQATPTGAQLDISSLAPALQNATPSQLLDLSLIFINTPDKLDLVEDIFISGYKLFHDEPALKPIIRANLFDWILDELPSLLQNQTVKDVYHVFVNEINKVNLTIVNQTSIETAMHDVFAQIDWFDTIIKMAGKIAVPLLDSYGVNSTVSSSLVPKLFASVEKAIKSYLPPLLPSLIGSINEFNLNISRPAEHQNSSTTTTKAPPAGNNTASIITFLLNSKDYALKINFTRQYLVNNPELVEKIKPIAFAALPLLFEPPTIRSEIQRLLLTWGFNKIPAFLRNEGLIRGYHYMASAMNRANLTGLNITDSHEFIGGVLKQLNILDILGKFASEIAVPLATSFGIKKDTAKVVVPKAVDEIVDLFNRYGTQLMMKILAQFNQINISRLGDTNYSDGVLANMFTSVLVGEILPNILSEPILNMFAVSTVNAILPKFLTDIPTIQQAEKILLSLVSLIKPLSQINPNIATHLLPWAANHVSSLVRNPLVTTALNIIVKEMNKFDFSDFNSTDDLFVSNLWNQFDLVHVVGTIATRVIVPWSMQAGMKPEVSMNLIPILSRSAEQLIKTDIVNLLHLLVTEMNSVNISDLDTHDQPEFVSTFLDRLNIRNIITGLIYQPHIKGLLTSTILKSPLVVMDIGKVILSSMNITTVLSLPQDARSPSTQKCYGGFMNFLGSLVNQKKWAVKMLDAYGKPPTGTLLGNTHFIGSFEECLSVGGMPNAPKTRYCRADFRLPQALVANLIGNVSTHGVPFRVTWGMCVSHDCNSTDVPALFRLGILESFGLRPESVVCSDEKPEFSKDTPAVALLYVACVVFVIVLLATVMHGCTRDKSKTTPTSCKRPNVYVNNAFVHENGTNGYGHVVNELKDHPIKRKVEDTETGNDVNSIGDSESIDDNVETGGFTRFISSISLFTGLRSILSFERNADDVACLHGIRALTVLWICVGNAYLFNAIWGGVTDVSVIANPLEALEFIKRFTFQFVMSGSLATDTFLMLSGFIITNRLLTYISRDESMKASTILLYYVRRYFRLTPVYIVILIGYATAYPYLGDGPTWPATLELADSCRHRWWYHILYVNNIVDIQGVIPFNQCMPWSWFNAVVMQLNIITPILIILFLASFKLGFTIVILLMLGGITATGVKEHRFGGDLLSSLPDHGNYWNNVFVAPWCRVSSYSVGVILAFIFFVKQRQKIDSLVAVVGWIISTLVGVCLVFISYLKYMENAKEWSLQEQAAYESLSRPAWACCIAWAIYACHYYGGGVINTVLSWRGFIPLSKLSYTMYLLNPIIVALFMFSRRTLTYVSDLDMVFLITSFYVITALCALIFSAIFEAPFLSLMRSMRKNDSVSLDKED